MVEDIHRSKILDEYIGRRVEIEFKNRECLSGVLQYLYVAQDGYKPGTYMLISSRYRIYFYKSNIKKIRLPNKKELPGCCL